jgi:hypothetical protein
MGTLTVVASAGPAGVDGGRLVGPPLDVPIYGAGNSVVEQRVALGFGVSEAELAAAEADAVSNGSVEDWGVPLTDAEVAEMAIRDGLSVGVAVAREALALHPEFAGTYIDHGRGGLVVFLFAGDGDPASYVDLVLATINDSAVKERARVRMVEFSLTDLTGYSENLGTKMTADSAVQGVGLDVPNNGLFVQGSPTASAEAIQDMISTAVPPAVPITIKIGDTAEDIVTTQTTGVERIAPSDFDASVISAPAVIVMGSRTVLVVFTTGSCSTPSDAPLLPRRLGATYNEDVVEITVDGSVECAGAKDDFGVDRAITVALVEAIGSRSIHLCLTGTPRRTCVVATR